MSGLPAEKAIKSRPGLDPEESSLKGCSSAVEHHLPNVDHRAVDQAPIRARAGQRNRQAKVEAGLPPVAASQVQFLPSLRSSNGRKCTSVARTATSWIEPLRSRSVQSANLSAREAGMPSVRGRVPGLERLVK
jgi:hypothetical protein